VTPRPRKVSDEEVFAAAYRAMTRLGPGELTLSEIAAEAGVTAGALSQRFGSKRQLLLRIAEGVAGAAGGFIREMRSAHRSPLAALRAYAECMADLAPSPAALARNLAYLQIDLSDPDFRVHLAAQARATRAGLEELLAEAVTVGELARGTDVRALTRTIEVVLSGSLLTWAFYQEGTASHWLRENVDAVLAPYLAARRRSRSSGGRSDAGSRTGAGSGLRPHRRSIRSDRPAGEGDRSGARHPGADRRGRRR
jgi:AcrR family transcriptional regulator